MIHLFLLAFGFITEASAQDMVVVDVRRNITLSENDPVYKDFYINTSPSSGLKKNLVVTAVRKINIRDASGSNAVGEIVVPVGQLKIIAVYSRVAVAREFTLLSRDELPMLEQTGIMSGDRIDIKGAFIDTSKPQRKQAAQPPTNATEVFATLTTSVNTSLVTPAPTEVPVAPLRAALPEAIPAAPNPVVSAAPPEGRSPSNLESLEKSAESSNNTLHE